MVEKVNGARIEVLASQPEKYALKDNWSVSQVPRGSQACSCIIPALLKNMEEAFRIPSRRSCQRGLAFVWGLLILFAKGQDREKTYVVVHIGCAVQIDSGIVGPLQTVDNCAILGIG